MIEISPREEGDELVRDIAPIADTKVAPAVGIAAIALNIAIKYHNINTVQDGALYQQYKLEGRNMVTLHLDMVFDTAMKMELFLLGASDRIAKIVIDALEVAIDDDTKTGEKDEGNVNKD